MSEQTSEQVRLKYAQYSIPNLMLLTFSSSPNVFLVFFSSFRMTSNILLRKVGRAKLILNISFSFQTPKSFPNETANEQA